MAGNIGDSFPVGATAPPAIGTAGPGFANTINSILTEAIARLSTKVKTASIDPANADVDMNTAYALKNAAYVSLASQSVAPSGAPFGRLARYAGNLYWIDSAGAAQITAGAGLNAAGIGGIVGDYGGVNLAKVSFVDASQTYEFYDDQAGGLWAILKAKRLDLVNAGGFVTQLTPSAAAVASFPITFPAAAFPSTSLVALTAAGQLQTAQTAAVTQFSVSADGIKHTDLEFMLGLATFKQSGGGGSPTQNNSTRVISSASGAANNAWTGVFDFPAIVGRRLKAAKARITQGTGGNPVTLKIFKSVDGAAAVQVGATASSAVSGTFTLTATASEVVTANTVYYLEVSFTDTTVGLVKTLTNLSVTYDYV